MSLVCRFNQVYQRSVIGLNKFLKNISSIKYSTNITMESKFEVLKTPIKSFSDKKEYKVIKLENGLIACLVSDNSPIDPEENEASDVEMESETESEQSESESDVNTESDNEGTSSGPEQKLAAAALCIGVGSFYDPNEVPGMAHFLEHMVFMGSEKFPKENDFDSFIQKSGGSDNASTDAETTCFYFETLEKNLLAALDKFSQFFISPLMKKEAMSREREAIESEFQMALPSDSSRKEQLFCSMAKEGCPVNSFSWGNLITLRDNISDDKLYAGVHEFRKLHYSAHRMTLAIQARLPMETLQQYVLDCFSNVPNNTLSKPDLLKNCSGLFDTPQFKRMYYVQPSKDLCQVDLTWALPSLLEKYKSKPQHYISTLMGDEGKGSLLSYLRKKVWVLGTSIGNGGSGIEHNSVYSLFTVSLVMTDEGLEHLNEVIEVVFSYINLLKKIGPLERVFSEMQIIADTAFKFSSEVSASDLVESLCESMQTYPPEHYISGSDLYMEYDAEGIKQILNHLRPDNMNVIVMSKKFKNDLFLDKQEKWFGTKYTDKEIPSDAMKMWSNPRVIEELSLPEPNKYLTTDFSILPNLDNNPSYPVNILKTPSAEVWYRKDDKFNLPRSFYYFYFISPLSLKSAACTAMLDMLHNLLDIDVTEELYPAVTADLSYKFSYYEKGLLLKVLGYNEKLPVLLNVLFTHMRDISKNIKPDMFSAVNRKMINNNYNKLIKPSNLAKDMRLNLLVDNTFGPVERYVASENLNYDDMIKFAEDFFHKLHVKVLVQGNVSEEKAKETVQKCISTLCYEPLKEDEIPCFSVIEIPKGEHCCRIESFNKNDSNSIITNYYQSGPLTIKDNVILEIILLIAEEPLFDMLRTKEQLGYHVGITVRDTFGILGYTITVNGQATKHTTEHIDSRIEAFIKHTRKLLKKLSKSELEHTKNTLKKMKQTVDVDLKEEVDRNWSEIIDNEYVFDRLQQEVNAISTITLNDLKDWWDKHNMGTSSFKKISIQVVGHNPKDNVDKYSKGGAGENIISALNLVGTSNGIKIGNKKSDYFITDINKFKKEAQKFPVRKDCR
ncbi:unnamed protein product [Brassicogethes aeneus]|uniref:Nardilysin n=1 Tax=Brassicogethes aeneus TaxID=1431903 RepID=A0A9P0B4K1_BRAAE|nr:unnamed protein product [Brassicogethes aeneus]